MTDCCHYDDGYEDGYAADEKEARPVAAEDAGERVIYATIGSPEAAYKAWMADEQDRRQGRGKYAPPPRVGLMKFSRGETT